MYMVLKLVCLLQNAEVNISSTCSLWLLGDSRRVTLSAAAAVRQQQYSELLMAHIACKPRPTAVLLHMLPLFAEVPRKLPAVLLGDDTVGSSGSAAAAVAAAALSAADS